jgi:hypothetical protein
MYDILLLLRVYINSEIYYPKAYYNFLMKILSRIRQQRKQA